MGVLASSADALTPQLTWVDDRKVVAMRAFFGAIATWIERFGAVGVINRTPCLDGIGELVVVYTCDIGRTVSTS
jgi:hypothetical protein